MKNLYEKIVRFIKGLFHIHNWKTIESYTKTVENFPILDSCACSFYYEKVEDVPFERQVCIKCNLQRIKCTIFDGIY